MSEMVCYLQAAYSPKDEPINLIYTDGLDYYDCFARLERMWDNEGLPRISQMDKFYLGTAIPLHMEEVYPHKEIREFIRYYRRTHAGRYLAAIKKMDDRVVAFAPNRCNLGVAAALLSPVRMYTEHTGNMRMFIKLCRTGMNPNAALLVAHFLTLNSPDEDFEKARKKVVNGHDAMAPSTRDDTVLKNIRGTRKVTPNNTAAFTQQRQIEGMPVISTGRGRTEGFSMFWWNTGHVGNYADSVHVKVEGMIEKNNKGANPVRPVGEECVAKLVRYVLNGSGYAMPNYWKEA